MASEAQREDAILKYVNRVQMKLTHPETTSDKVIKYLENLRKLPISLNILKLSGVGKTVNKLKKQDGMAGDLAKMLIATWKVNVSPVKSQKVETETKGTSSHRKKAEAEAEKTESNVMDNNKDHWKDVSLNLLGDRASEKTRKKHKTIKLNEKVNGIQKAYAQPVIEEPKKKHLIEVRHDPSIPSLPDIKLPEIQRTYRPSHFSYSFDEQDETPQRKKAKVADEELESIIVSRKSRTQVFSGRRSCYGGVVQSLYNQCLRVLADNLDALENTGGVPFDILEPLLSKASPAQLIRLEEFNPYFTEDSGGLWKKHCEREFRGSVPDEMESWREMYLRKCVERSEKLKNIQLKISESQSKKEPAKQAKLAYVAAPSLQIRRKQMRHGTGEYANGNENKTKKVKEKVDEMHKNEATHTVAFVKVPKRERLASDARRSNQRSEISGKKTSCRPMMKAAMKMMKNQRSRSTKQIMRK